MYVPQSELEDRLGAAELARLTDDFGAGSINATVLAQAIADGEADILNWINQKYVLPLSLGNAATAYMVKSRMADCIEYRLHRRRAPAPEDVVETYRWAIEWAQKVAAGEIGLVGETELSESPHAAGNPVIQSEERVIDRDAMRGL
jgi:phage gp36-like protein